MKKILFILLFPFIAYGQATESEIKSDIDAARVLTLTPARVYNILDKINYGKQSIKGIYTATGTNTYAVTAGAGIINNDNNIQIIVKFTNANTSSTVTLNVNALGALPLKTNLGADPDIGGIAAGSIYLLGTTGSVWRIIGPTNEGGTAVTNWGDIPTGNLEDQTDLYDTLNTRARRWYTVKTVSSNYTAALGDENNKFIVVNGGADFKIPKAADVDFPTGSALLVADSLGTATFSKDALVHMDTVDTHVYINMGGDRWITPRAATGGGSTTLTDGSGTTANGSAIDLGGTMNSDVMIETNGHVFSMGDLDGSGQGIALDDDSFIAGYGNAQITVGDVANEITIFAERLEIGGSGATSNAIFDTNVALAANDDITLSSGSGSGDDIILSAVAGRLRIDNLVTTPGTTGAQTINHTSGIVNFAAGATSLVVTNSHCSSTSMVFVQVLGVDTTPKYAVVTKASGSFTITLNAAAVAELPVAFFVIN